MADVRTEDEGMPAGSARGRRAPPTIEVEATELASRPLAAPPDQTTNDATSAADRRDGAMGDGAKADGTSPPAGGLGSPEAAAEVSPSVAPPSAVSPSAVSPAVVSPWVIAPFAGAVAAALVLGVGWMLGWPAPKAPPPASAVVELKDRLTRVEADLGRLAAAVKTAEVKAGGPGTAAVAAGPDPATVARLTTMEQSLDGLRSSINGLRQQAGDGSVRVANDEGAAAIKERVDALAASLESQRGELGQLARSLTEARAKAAKGNSGDAGLRRLVAVSLLDLAVRNGDPFVARLAVVRAILGDASELKPLDGFAASGIPTREALCRELVEIVPKLATPKGESSGGGIINQLQANASKLVHIEHTGVTEGSGRGAIVSRITHAALHNHFNLARTELKSLSEADRAPAQGWLDRADAREAALAASHKVADDAMAELGKSAELAKSAQ